MKMVSKKTNAKSIAVMGVTGAGKSNPTVSVWGVMIRIELEVGHGLNSCKLLFG